MSSRFVYVVAALLLLTAGYACWCKAPLIWDGAYQLNWTLINQHPYSYTSRFHTFFLWWPTVWASHGLALGGKVIVPPVTNLTALSTIYGLPFLLAPLIGLLGSWWIVKKDAPQLIIWPIFGICAGSLPGQIFVINDSIFQLNLFWPIFMAIFVPVSPGKWIVLAVLIVFQFVHQLGSMLFAEAVVAALVLAWFDPENRQRLLRIAALMGALCLLTIAKMIITKYVGSLRDTYAEQESSYRAVMNMWGSGVKGWPLYGLLFMWSSAVLVFIHRRYQTSGDEDVHATSTLGISAILLVALGMACWIHWASNDRLWWKALDYRRWVGPLTTPFFILAALEALMARLPRAESLSARFRKRLALRGPLALLLGATFAGVMCSQCAGWHEMTGQLVAEVEHYPGTVVAQSDVPWIDHTALAHWAAADFIMAVQGKHQKKILIIDPRTEDNLYKNPPQILHSDIYLHPPDPGPAGWYDWSDFLKHLPPKSARHKGIAPREDANTSSP